jgi:hypothetical protein
VLITRLWLETSAGNKGPRDDLTPAWFGSIKGLAGSSFSTPPDLAEDSDDAQELELLRAGIAFSSAITS